MQYEDEEIWKPVDGTDGYYSVSSHGRVRSEYRVILKSDGRFQPVPERILKPLNPTKCERVGDLVSLATNVGHPNLVIKISDLVYSTFVGEIDSFIFHLDGDIRNNHYTNLTKVPPQDCPDFVEFELWKDIKGFESAYMISSLGRVWSKGRSVEYIKNNRVSYKYQPGRIMTPKKAIRDFITYEFVNLSSKNKGKPYRIHRLVAEHFLDNPKNLPVVMHLDDNPINNQMDNLKWGTQKENIQQTTERGRRNDCKGERSPNASINDDTARLIKELIKSGMSNKDIHIHTKASKQVITKIRNGHSWKHVTLN